MKDDEAPDYPPRTIIVTWVPGQPLDVEPRPTDAWEQWEVEAALEQALEVVTYADTREDQEP